MTSKPRPKAKVRKKNALDIVKDQLSPVKNKSKERIVNDENNNNLANKKSKSISSKTMKSTQYRVPESTLHELSNLQNKYQPS